MVLKFLDVYDLLVQVLPLRIRFVIPLLLTLSGLILALLLPLGYYSELKISGETLVAGIHSKLFQYTFLAHLILLLVAAFMSLVFIFRATWLSHFSLPILLALLLLTLTALVTTGLLPPILPEALSTNLFVPQSWEQIGRITEISWHDPAYMPMLIELGFTALIANGYVDFCGIYNLLFLLTLCGLVGTLVYHKTQSAEATVFSFILTLTLPICQKLSTLPVSGLGQAAFFSAAISLLLYWIETGSSLLRVFLLVSSAAALGLGMATGLPGLIGGIALFPSVLLLTRRANYSLGRTVLALFNIALITLLVTGPWFARNFIWTGNPIYPLGKRFMGVSNLDIRYRPQQVNFSVRSERYEEGIGDLLLYPVRLLLFGRDGSLRDFNGVLSPLLLLGFVPLLRRKYDAFILALYSLVAFHFALVVNLCTVQTAAFAPIFGALLFLSGFGFAQTAALFFGRYRRILAISLVLIQSAIGVVYSFELTAQAGTYRFFQDRDKHAYLLGAIPEYDLIQYTNEHIPETARLYLLFVGDSFYFYKAQVRSQGKDSASWLRYLLRTYKVPKELAQEFETAGIDYLLTNKEALNHRLELKLEGSELSCWTGFKQDFLEEVHSSGDYVLYRLRSVLPEQTEAPLAVETPTASDYTY